MRRRVGEAQNWRCAYCYCDISPETATLDHVVPIAKGGADDWENIVAACEPCNYKKKAEIPLGVMLSGIPCQIFNALPLSRTVI